MTQAEPGAMNRITVSYNLSYYYGSIYYIHKYYLSSNDKEMLSPADICALRDMFYDDNSLHEKLNNGVVPINIPDVIVYYKDIKLEKQIKSDLARRGMLAIASYWQESCAIPTAEEIRAALSLNEWLRSYEKTLRAKQLSIEQRLIDGLRGDDPFLTDYEIDLTLDFYVRSDDPFCENEEASLHDWDIDTSFMCRIEDMKVVKIVDAVNDPDYWGLGDDQDHNDNRGHCDNPIFQASHCTLFHELISHRGVPIKHLIRIGGIWADFKIIQQNAVDIDLTGEQVVVSKVEPYKMLPGDS